MNQSVSGGHLEKVDSERFHIYISIYISYYLLSDVITMDNISYI